MSSDSSGDTTTETLQQSMTLSSRTPICTDVSASTTENKPVTVQLACTNPSNSQLNYFLATQPHHAANWSFEGGRITYTPAPGFTGTDTFTYSAEPLNGLPGNTATAKDHGHSADRPIKTAEAPRACQEAQTSERAQAPQGQAAGGCLQGPDGERAHAPRSEAVAAQSALRRWPGHAQEIVHGGQRARGRQQPKGRNQAQGRNQGEADGQPRALNRLPCSAHVGERQPGQGVR